MLVEQTRPDVVLMDSRMPELDGIAATRESAADPALADVRVLIQATFESDDTVVDAQTRRRQRLCRQGHRAGRAHPRYPHDRRRRSAALAPNHETTDRGGASPPPREQPENPVALEELTPRERDVIVLVADGLSNNEIAERLVVSPATAKTHFSRTMLKLGARDRAQLVVIAYQTGLVRTA